MRCRSVPSAEAARRSVPTPGDAAGSITVGAVDWRGNTLKCYSSQGPTLDGRRNRTSSRPPTPASSAPRVRVRWAGRRTPHRTRRVWPRSSWPPGASRRSRSHDAVRATLEDTALDLGEPGSDPAFGFGRVRRRWMPPGLSPIPPRPGSAVRGPVRVQSAGSPTIPASPGGRSAWTEPPHGPAAARGSVIARHAVTGRRPAHGRGGGPGHAGKRRPGELHDRGRQHPSRAEVQRGRWGPRCARGRRGRPRRRLRRGRGPAG